MNKILIALAIFLLTAGVCSADNYCGGMPLTTVKEGIVSGGVFSDSYYYNGDQGIYKPNTIDKTFTLPDDIDIEWAMLMTTVYCGQMQRNYEGTANVTFNNVVLGNETLNVPFTYIYWGGNDNSLFPPHSTGEPYKMVNDHVNRVTSDYLMWYDVTDLVLPSSNTASVHTDQITNNFDGRIKLVTLIVAYNDDSGNEIYYWVNKGHDVDNYYLDYEGHNDYIGSTDFAASLFGQVQDASLTVVHMASKDGSYTFNGNSLPSGTPQGSYSGSNTWDVTSIFNQNGDNTMTYDRRGPFYKIPLGILTVQVIPSIPVTIDIKPGRLDLNSSGILKAYIILPEGYNATVEDINVSTVTCEGAPVFGDGSVIPGKQALEVKFKIPDLVGVEPGPEVLLTVTGELYDGTLFEGSNMLKVV
jgi:hypothetical protein